MEGQIVLVRAYSSGVNYGKLVSINGTTVELQDSQRIYSWSGALETNCIASTGVSSAKVSQVVSKKIILDAIEVIKMTDGALQTLNACKPWER